MQAIAIAVLIVCGIGIAGIQSNHNVAKLHKCGITDQQIHDAENITGTVDKKTSDSAQQAINKCN